jgi:hypothetical protein
MLKSLLLGACLVTSMVAFAGEPAASQDTKAKPALNGGYLQHPCTRIAHHCATVAGRVYTREDLDRTGAPTIAQALRLLDPSIAVH